MPQHAAPSGLPAAILARLQQGAGSAGQTAMAVAAPILLLLSLCMLWRVRRELLLRKRQPEIRTLRVTNTHDSASSVHRGASRHVRI